MDVCPIGVNRKWATGANSFLDLQDPSFWIDRIPFRIESSQFESNRFETILQRFVSPRLAEAVVFPELLRASNLAGRRSLSPCKQASCAYPENFD